MKEAEKRRFELRHTDKIILGIIAVMVVAIVVLNILQRCGQTLINGALMLFLPTLMLFVLVGWIGYVLIRHIPGRTARIVVGSIGGVVLVIALLLVFTYVSFFASFSVPREYATLRSPSGEHTLVVLRALDSDEERIDQRVAARLAADPEGSEEVTAEDWGYVYKAYPLGLLGMFYKSNANVEGEVYLSYREAAPAAAEEGQSEDEAPDTAPIGVMMLEWLDDESTAHFFVQDPGVAEGGECYVRF